MDQPIKDEIAAYRSQDCPRCIETRRISHQLQNEVVSNIKNKNRLLIELLDFIDNKLVDLEKTSNEDLYYQYENIRTAMNITRKKVQ